MDLTDNRPEAHCCVHPHPEEDTDACRCHCHRPWRPTDGVFAPGLGLEVVPIELTEASTNAPTVTISQVEYERLKASYWNTSQLMQGLADAKKLMEKVDDRMQLNDRLVYALGVLLKMRDLIEYGPFFGTEATELFEAADIALAGMPRTGYWQPVTEVGNGMVRVLEMVWTAYPGMEA